VAPLSSSLPIASSLVTTLEDISPIKVYTRYVLKRSFPLSSYPATHIHLRIQATVTPPVPFLPLKAIRWSPDPVSIRAFSHSRSPRASKRYP
jgi:hypothetical protein